MENQSAALPVLQKHWDSTCRMLFGEEVGAIPDYEGWLLRYTERILHRKSSLSGKEISYSVMEYDGSSKWIGFDEIDFQKRAPGVEITGIGSIGAVADSLRDRFYYVGSAVLGNSKFVERSSGISDSFYMYEAGKLTECKYIAYSTFGRLNEDCFGCNGIGESAFCIKSHETFRNRRCFELWQSRSCSDCYYSHNLDDCQECFFCFNAKNLRHAIGNVQLPKEKYYEVKKRLQKEMALGLKESRRLPSLMDIVAACPGPKKPVLTAVSKPEKTDKSVIDEAFAKTCAIVLGERLPEGIDGYAAYLKRNVRRNDIQKSAASGKEVHRSDHCCFFELPIDRLLTMDEAREAGEKLKIGKDAAEGITIANAHKMISGISFFCTEYRDGMNINIIECATAGDSAHCYRCTAAVFSKYSGYSFWPRNGEHMFGCGSALSSEFCVRCFNSVKLSRSFECDFCRNCSGLYFSHNCENVHDSMFCFNAKNLKYAIGNVEVGREKFMALRRQLLALARQELAAKKGLRYSIYNIGAK